MMAHIVVLTVSDTTCRVRLVGRIVTINSPPAARRSGFLAFGGANMDGAHWPPKLVAVRLNGIGEQKRLNKKAVNTLAGSW